MSTGMTIKEATKKWVAEFNRVPREMISMLMDCDAEDWCEVTTPSAGNRVYFYADTEGNGNGEIVKVKHEEDDTIYEIELDCGRTVTDAREGEFEVIRYNTLPMWGTMWSFEDSSDECWLDEEEGIKAMSECGFNIYKSEKFGYYFGIDGAGYDFYEQHWIPLYLKRGLQWHDEELET